METVITITAVDKHSSESMSKSFSTLYSENFEIELSGWLNNIPYRRYNLLTQDFIEDYSYSIQNILDEFEIDN